MHCGVGGPDTVGESVAGGPWSAGCSFPVSATGVSAAAGVSSAVAARMQAECLDTQRSTVCIRLVPEVPPIGDLNGLRRTGCGAVNVGRAAVAADDFDRRVLEKPGGYGLGFPVGRQVQGPAGLHIDDHDSVDMSLSEGVVVNADGRSVNDREYRPCTLADHVPHTGQSAPAASERMVTRNSPGSTWRSVTTTLAKPSNDVPAHESCSQHTTKRCRSRREADMILVRHTLQCVTGPQT